MSSLTPSSARPVVVGLDESPESRRALDWAVAEARSRSLPLRLVHALETGVTVWSPMMVVPPYVDSQRAILRSAVDHLHLTEPDLEVTSAITSGPAAVALELASAEADCVVVGAGGHGVVGSILLGSTSLHLVNHARCPAIVVRDRDVDAARPPRRVVVGVDGSHLSDDALAYAFGAAAHRHLPLDVVTAWDVDELLPYQRVPSLADEVRGATAHHRHELAAAAAAPWSEKYPEVELRIHVTTDPPAQALVDRTVDAALVVVGSRGLGSVRGALVGSVSAQVLHHAHCPVAVIRPDVS